LGFNDQRFIDLHIHSTASDGTLEPLEIIDLALEIGLSAISITDHDTTDGCKQVLARPAFPSLNFLTGVEISASFPPGIRQNGSIHILGYNIDINDPCMNLNLADLRAARNDRSPRILRRLNEIGIELSMRDIAPFAKGNQTGRPHIAQAMLHYGYVSSINEAFDKYIGKKGIAYVDKQRIPCSLAIELIVNSGGIPVLAHPGLIGLTDEAEMKALIDVLVKMGIKGIEAYYPGHSEKQTEFFLKLAREFRLLLSGGSDFHGGLNPEIQMGKGTGNLFVKYEIYEKLIAFNRKKQS